MWWYLLAYLINLGLTLTLGYFGGDYIKHLPIGYLGVLWCIANVLDCHSTILGLKNKKGREVNPIIRFFVEIFGITWGLIGFKVIFGLLFSVILFYFPIVMLSITIVLFAVAVNNYCRYLYSKPNLEIKSDNFHSKRPN